MKKIAQIFSTRAGSIVLVILTFIPVLFWYLHLGHPETETLVRNGKYRGILSEVFLLGFFVGWLTLISLAYALPKIIRGGGQTASGNTQDS